MKLEVFDLQADIQALLYFQLFDIIQLLAVLKGHILKKIASSYFKDIMLNEFRVCKSIDLFNGPLSVIGIV